MIHTFSDTLNQIVYSFFSNFPLLLLLLLSLWAVHCLNYFFNYRLNYLGIVPRRLWSLLGIFFSPFLHASWEHLLVNSIMLFVLSVMVLLHGRTLYFEVSFLIILISGFLIWLLARRGRHVGASSLVMGYFGYLLVDSFNHPSIISVLITFVCLYYFSGVFVNLFPKSKRVSWEGHLFGFIAGIVVSFTV